jgi:hypothetical protein
MLYPVNETLGLQDDIIALSGKTSLNKYIHKPKQNCIHIIEKLYQGFSLSSISSKEVNPFDMHRLLSIK